MSELDMVETLFYQNGVVLDFSEVFGLRIEILKALSQIEALAKEHQKNCFEVLHEKLAELQASEV